jgi:hypothetical protein
MRIPKSKVSAEHLYKDSAISFGSVRILAMPLVATQSGPLRNSTKLGAKVFRNEPQWRIPFWRRICLRHRGNPIIDWAA